MDTPMTDHSAPFLYSIATLIMDEDNADVVFSKNPAFAASLVSNPNLSAGWLVDKFDKNNYHTHILLRHHNFPMNELVAIAKSEPGMYGENDIAMMSHNPNLSVEVMNIICHSPSRAAMYGLVKNPTTPHNVLINMVECLHEYNPDYIVNFLMKFIMHPNYNRDVARAILTKFQGQLDEASIDILLDSFQ